MAATDLSALLAELHASEINCGLQTFYDVGARVWVGDEMNGEAAEETFAPEQFALIAAWLEATAIRLHPASTFALRRCGAQ